MSNTELHAKILGFLAGEIARKEGRQCTKIDLLYAQTGAREEELRTWTRTEEPEVFEGFTKTEEMVNLIIDIAEQHADTFGMGGHRYTLRTHQHLGGRANHSFRLLPSAISSGEDTSLVLSGSRGGSEGAMGVVTQNNLALMRTNQAMFQASFGTLASLTDALRKDNYDLKIENVQLRRERDEALSNKDEKEFERFKTMESLQLKQSGIKQLMQFGQIAIAKIAGNGASGPTGLSMLVGKFGESLRKDQLETVFGILDMAQRAMLMEIMNTAASMGEQSTAQNAPPPNGVNGAPQS